MNELNPDLLRELGAVIVRYVGPPVIAWLTLKVGLTNDQATATVIGLVTFAISMAWALLNKVKTQGQINTALDMPKGTSKEVLKETIKQGDGISATALK